MAVHLQTYAVSYFSVPKCACTSMKHLFFEVENGFAWRGFRVSGRRIDLHIMMPSRAFRIERTRMPAGNWSFALIRDPISRLISTYRNRLMHHGRKVLERNRGWLEQRAIPVRPDVNEFVAHYDTYSQLVPKVRGHLKPLTYHLGRDPNAFDAIYTLKQIPQMLEDLRQRIPNLPALRHLQRRGPDVSEADLTAPARAWIEDKYAEDYAIYGSRF